MRSAGGPPTARRGGAVAGWRSCAGGRGLGTRDPGGGAGGERRAAASTTPRARSDGATLHLGGRVDPQRAGAGSLSPARTSLMNLPMFGATDAPLLLEDIPALQAEVRSLAERLGAVI